MVLVAARVGSVVRLGFSATGVPAGVAEWPSGTSKVGAGPKRPNALLVIAAMPNARSIGGVTPGNRQAPVEICRGVLG
eukprot:11156328-Lingulodinium_polyedra.AAC.1